MAPTITSATELVFPNAEISFGTIANAAGFDFIDVFVDGTANPTVIPTWRLYEIVAGVETLVASAPGGGSEPGVIDWGIGGVGAPSSPFVQGDAKPYSPAEGVGVTFELRAFLSESIISGGPTPQFTASLVGYDEYDNVANASASATLQIPANFSSVQFAALGGYAQYADAIAITNPFAYPIKFQLVAQAGPVFAVVASITLLAQGSGRIFDSPVRLPGATEYFLRAAFDSQQIQIPPTVPVFVTAALGTRSQTIPMSGGTVILDGNVNGPSNANEWQSFMNVQMRNANAAIPNTPDGGWFYVGASGFTGGHILTLPLVPVDGEVVAVTDETGFLATQTLTIDGNGKGVQGNPSLVLDDTYPGPFGSVALQYDADAPTPGWFIFADYSANAPGAPPVVHGIEAVNRNVLSAEFSPATGEWYVGISGLTGNVSVTLNDAMPSGSKVTVKDEDGSLGSFNISILTSSGKTIDGSAPPYVMNAADPGAFGARTFQMNFASPTEWAVV
jgi:hypothetical protein